MNTLCAGCGKTFDAKRKTARFCGPTCRQRSHRRPDRPVAPVPPITPDGLSEPALVAAMRKELESAERLDTFLGQQALQLAAQMAAGGETGSAMAALSKELRAVMTEALANAPKAADSLDELAQRRVRKASGA